MPETSVIKTVPVGDKVLEVTRTEVKVDTYTLKQVEQTIVAIQAELANVQARLAYQVALRAQLTK